MNAISEKTDKVALSSPQKEVFGNEMVPNVVNGDLKKENDLDESKMDIINNPFEDNKELDIVTKIDDKKPSFIADALWSQYQHRHPWLYYSKKRFLCSYCQEAFKKDQGMVPSTWTCDVSGQLQTGSSNRYYASRTRFERHAKSHNHCLAENILKLTKTDDDWLSLKVKYPWLDGDLDHTRCSLCEEAYKKHKKIMIITIWTCPELKNEHSPTHFSTAHRLDRHEKCKNHLLASKLEKDTFTNYQVSPVKSSSDISFSSPIIRHSSIGRLASNNSRSHSCRLSQKNINNTLTQNVRRSRKSAPVKSSCKQTEVVLPRSISTEKFRNLKSRFTWLACCNEMSFRCNLCPDLIKFDRDSSLTTISQIIFSHFHKNEQQNRKATRITRLQMGISPKINYKLLSSGILESKIPKEDSEEKVDVGPWSCPQCRSHFVHNISLIEHISLCDNQSTDVVRELSCPCHTHLYRFQTITKLDLHAAQDHTNQPLFHCYICSDRHIRLLGLYEHMIVHHLIDWDPFDAYAPLNPLSPSSECIFCSTNLKSNVELTNHYCQSNCNKFLQPAVVVEEIVVVEQEIRNEIALPEKPSRTKKRKSVQIKENLVHKNVVNVQPDVIDEVLFVEDIEPITEKKDSTLDSVFINEIPTWVCDEKSTDNLKLVQVPLKENVENENCKTQCNENDSGNIENVIEKCEEIALISNKNTNETVTVKCAENILENIEYVEKCDAYETFSDKNVKRPSGINDSDDNVEVNKVLKNHINRRNENYKAVEILPEENQGTGVSQKTATPKRRRRRSSLLTCLEYVVPVDGAKRIRAPSEKLKENAVHRVLSEIKKEKRTQGKPPPKKMETVKDCAKEPTEVRKRARAKTDKLEGPAAKRRRKTSATIIDDRVEENVLLIGENESKLENSSEIVRKNDQTVQLSSKIVKRLRKSPCVPKKIDKEAEVISAIINITNVADIIKPVETCENEIGGYRRPQSLTINVVETDGYAPSSETMKLKRPVMIRSQVSPPSGALISDSKDDDVVQTELSFMDRMKKIRQLKKIRTEQDKREQMMADDQAAAHIHDKVRRRSFDVSKKTTVKKRINSEQKSMSDLKDILHKRIRKRKSTDTENNKVLNKLIMNSPNSSKVNSPNTSKFESPEPQKVHKSPKIPKLDVFVCDVCLQKFRSLRARDQHVIAEHKGTKIFKCKICDLGRSTHYALRKHALKDHADNASFAVFGDENHINVDFSFQCQLCSLQFTSKSGMNHHVTSIHRYDSDKQKPLKDTEINISTIAPDEFVNSLKEANPLNDSQECPMCDEIMHNGLELAIHIIEHQREADSHIEANQFACPKCCRLFFGKEGKTYLKDHYNIVHLEKPQPFCDDCKTDFSSTWCYYEHKRVMKNCIKKTAEQLKITDPYEELNDELRLAFVCSRCQTLVAGESAQLRFEQHQVECSEQLTEDLVTPSVTNDS